MAGVQVLMLFALLVSTDGFPFFSHEDIILVPSVALRGHSTDWLLYNQGWYYEENPIQAMILQKSLEKVIKKDLDIGRIRMFTGDGEEHQSVCIDGLNRTMCTTTDEQGRIKNTFRMRDDEIRQFVQANDSTGKLLYQVSNAKKNVRTTGEIYLCDDHGISFLSDIDDTIKITGVTSPTDTLINTFSGQFRAVPGMSRIYRTWQHKYNGTFAYVTGSPDQLYPSLRAFLDREQFPAGSAHMRHFTWLDGNFISFFTSTSYVQSKTETINMFLDNTVNRTLVLMGDIFQQDPEIYASVYVSYPHRIGHIFIRKYVNDTVGQQRLEQVFAHVPRQKWATFETGSDLPDEMPLSQ